MTHVAYPERGTLGFDIETPAHGRASPPGCPPRPWRRGAAGTADAVGDAGTRRTTVGLHRDLVFGLRMLRKNSLLLVVASLSLGLGIGLNTTVFSAVHAILFRAPNIERADDLVNFYSVKEGVRDSNPSSYADFLDMRERLRSVDALVGHSLALVNFERQGLPTPQFGAVVTSGYFELLGTRPSLGRLLQDDDFEAEASVVVVSHRFWQNELTGDPGAIGRSIRLGTRVFEVVGVLPQDFVGLSRGLLPNIFVPITQARGIQPIGEVVADGPVNGRDRIDWRGLRFLNVTGRLAPGTTIAAAQAEASTLANVLAQEYPDSNVARGVLLLETGSVRFDPEIDAVLVPVAILLLTLVALVLLVACGNVANLLLAKAQSRGGEMALRTALGASRAQIVSQLLVESLLYGLICGAVGLGLASLAIQLFGLVRLDLPFQPELALRLDAPALLFTLGLSLATSLVFGLIPARHASRLALVPLLRSAGATTAAASRWFHPSNLLVVGQVAVSLVLIVVAGLLFRSLGAARGVDVGFEVERLGSMSLELPSAGQTPGELTALWRRIEDRIEALPGIETVTLTTRMPLGTNLIADNFFIPGHRDTAADPPLYIDLAGVDEDYFATLGLELVSGRLIDARDRPGTPLVAVVTDAMAQRFWPGDSALGKQVRIGAGDNPQIEIVGVVRDYKIRTPGEAPRPMVHFAWQQRPGNNAVIAYRSTGPAEPMLEQVVATARAEIPNLLVVQSTTMTRMRDLLLLPLSAGSIAAAALGSLALFLAILGLSGLIIYWVNRRTREIGLRIALGAHRNSVLRLIVGRTFALIGVGLVLGGAAAVVLARVLEPALYVSGFDPLSLAVGVGVLLIGGMIASVVPVRRATSIDPMRALRQE
jgi:predicted permease